MSKKIDHMIQAISELKTYKAPDYVWEEIVSELDSEIGVDHLNRSIRQLKRLRKAPDSVWEKLEVSLKQMCLEEPLQKAIDDLPNYVAPEFSELILPKQSKQRTFHTLRWISGIAASLLLFFGIYFVYENDNHEKLTSYTEIEEQPGDIVKAAIAQLDAEDEILEVIEVHCAQIAIRCESPEFKGLFDYYLELDASKEELINVMNDNQEQVQLVDYLVRVEKEKDEVGKQLIQMIIG